MEQLGWDKLRVLVTNKCNYKCPFCHNEGQEKECGTETMSLGDFKSFVDMLCGQPLSELNFSGGEPFINKEIVEMIEYACEKLTCDVSCATNLSLMNEEYLSRLAKTRVKFNIQFPYINEDKFFESTGNGKLKKILDNIRMVRTHNIEIGLNTVVQTKDVRPYMDMILFAIQEELPLKLLPQIGNDDSCRNKELLYPILQEYAIDYKDKKSGATRWVLKKDNHQTSVLYIDSPCFYKDIEQCRNFSEIRIHPDFSIQPCIMNDVVDKLELSKGKEYVINQLNHQWKNFKSC